MSTINHQQGEMQTSNWEERWTTQIVHQQDLQALPIYVSEQLSEECSVTACHLDSKPNPECYLIEYRKPFQRVLVDAKPVSLLRKRFVPKSEYASLPSDIKRQVHDDLISLFEVSSSTTGTVLYYRSSCLEYVTRDYKPNKTDHVPEMKLCNCVRSLLK